MQHRFVRLGRRQSHLHRRHRRESDHRLILAVDGVVLDAIAIHPVWTTDGEHGARGAAEGRDRAGAIARRLIDQEAHRTRAGARRQRVHDLKAPIFDRRIRQKQLARRSEVARVGTYEHEPCASSSSVSQDRERLTEEPDVLLSDSSAATKVSIVPA